MFPLHIYHLTFFGTFCCVRESKNHEHNISEPEEENNQQRGCLGGCLGGCLEYSCLLSLDEMGRVKMEARQLMSGMFAGLFIGIFMGLLIGGPTAIITYGRCCRYVYIRCNLHIARSVCARMLYGVSRLSLQCT